MEKVNVIENISKIFADYLLINVRSLRSEVSLNSDVRTCFLSWLKIMNQTPTVFNRGNKIYFGLPFEFQRWICTNKEKTEILKFVCGSPSNVINDNF